MSRYLPPILFTLLFTVISGQTNAQIMIDPYVEGEYRNDVVYVGTYGSPGNCTWADGADFGFDFSGLTAIDGMEYVLIIDAPDPSNTSLLNGWQPVNVGDSTVFTPATTTLGISAGSGPATIHFHIRLVGTPSSSGQEHPCWIDAAMTLAKCDNIYALYNGESLVPCFVSPSVGISDILNDGFRFDRTGRELTVTSDMSCQLSIFNIEGQRVFQKQINSGTNRLNLTDIGSGIYIIRLVSEDKTYTQKILFSD